jgi:glucose/arabinose dehydrogenase
VRRSPGSFGTPGGRLVLFLAATVILGGVLFAAWWLRPSGPLAVDVVQDGLEHPWDLAFADDGRMVVTERIGRVRVFAGAEAGAELLHTATVPDVRAELESGLMGIAIHGDAVFLCATRGPDPEDHATWRVDLLRSRLAADGSLAPFEALPIGPAQGAPRHQGCALEIGPDERLWLTIGDANLPAGENRAQDPAILNGKVLRLELDGTVPADAAFPSGAVSIGHRNPQGLAFRGDGLILEVEHGTDVNDEVNVIRAGANYGYPCVTGASEPGPIPDACVPDAELTAPAWASGSPTLATSGATFLAGPAWGAWAGDLVVTTLKEEDLRRFSVSPDGRVTAEETLLDAEFGRLRAAVIGPDGALYLSTANGDGDRILRVELSESPPSE